MAKQAVAKKEENAVAAFSPNMFEADAGQGMENMGQEDLALPFLKVLSRQDPTLDDLDDAKAGDILNTVTNTVYKGKDGVCVVPCAYQRRFIEWAPRGQGSGAPVNIYAPGDNVPATERSSDDNKDYLTDGSGHYIEETHQHFVLVLNEDGSFERALIAMKATQLKKSRKWNSMISSITLTGANGPFTPPRFSHVYRMKTISEENSKGSWHGWEMAKERMLGEEENDAALYATAKTFNESVSEGNVNVKHGGDEDPEPVVSDEVPF